VDRRTTALLASLRKEDALVTDLTPEGDVTVEGHLVGRLRGLSFEPVVDARTLEGKAVRSAALAAIRPMLAGRLAEIASAPAEAFKLTEAAEIEYKDAPVARLGKGAQWMTPRTELIGAVEAEAAERQPALARIEEWVRGEIGRVLATHAKLAFAKSGEALEGLLRGLAFRILESGAAIDLRTDESAPRLNPEQREALKSAGIRVGRVAAYAPDAQKPAAQRMIAILKAVESSTEYPLAPEGAGSFGLDGTWPEPALAANGYLRFGRRAVRADLAERLGWELAKRRKDAAKAVFEIPIDLASVISCPAEDWPAVLKGFGIAPAEKNPETGAVTLWRYVARARPDAEDRPARRPPRADTATPNPEGAPRRDRRPKDRPEGRSEHGSVARPDRRPDNRRPTPPPQPERRAKPIDPDSPFAALAALLPPPKPAKPARPQKQRPPKTETARAPGAFRYRPFR
jgi:ATP-dependent RNA helicase SUPV3L1/SUV3